MRCAAIQVEMDEFMTLRRLNLRIQGFPESYAAEPYMDDDMVVGEPHPHSVPSGPPPPLTLDDPMMGPSDHVGLMGSPMRGSPITEDPIAA